MIKTKPKAKYRVGSNLYWNSKKQGKRIEGKVIKKEYFMSDWQYTLLCGTEGRWEVGEQKLKKV